MEIQQITEKAKDAKDALDRAEKLKERIAEDEQTFFKIIMMINK